MLMLIKSQTNIPDLRIIPVNQISVGSICGFDLATSIIIGAIARLFIPV